ncbi:metacaspase-2-like isoform X2 [Daktulosphaira vitifoliae]|nr:metacaspase-2-like isoform X2 [Daktulosphaira vitifoliae]
MAESLEELKINIRSLLTSSPKKLSIEQLLKDYYAQEGEKVPYVKFGFKTIFDLLRIMSDVLVLPPNPNKDTLLTLVVGDKTSHLRNLVVKQKIPKKKKSKSGLKNRFNVRISNGNKIHGGNNYRRNQINYVANKNQSFNNFTYKNNKDYQHNTTHYNKTYHCQPINQQIINNDKVNKNEVSTKFNSIQSSFSNTTEIKPKIVTKSLNASCFEDKGIYSSSLSSSFSSTSSETMLQKSVSHNLYNLHSYIRHFLSKSETEHTLDSLKKHIQSNPTYSNIDEKLIDTEIINFKDLMDSRNMYLYLENNKKLKDSSNISNQSTNMIKIVTSTPIGSQTSKFPHKKECNQNSSFKKNCSINQNDHKKEVKISKVNNCNLGKNNFGPKTMTDYVMNRVNANSNLKLDHKSISLIDKSKYLCQVMQSKNNSNNVNNLNKNALVNGLNNMQSNCSLNHSTSLNNCGETSNNIFGSKIIYCDNENLNKIFYSVKDELHKKLLSNMIFLLRNYFCAIHLNNLKYIYNRSFDDTLEPNNFGFSSDEELLKFFDGIISMKINIIYPKPSLKNSNIHEEIFNRYKNNLKNISTKDINCKYYSEKNIEVTFKLDQEKLPIIQNSKDRMVLSEVYNPTLFYLRLAYKTIQLEQLSTKIQKFYGQEQEESRYLVNPEHITPGRVFVTSYLSYSNIKHWNRVKVLKEIDKNSVEILQVDYGTVDCIPKSELRLMKTEFSTLPGQAIQCCLTGYNEICTIPVDVTEAFVKLTNNIILDVLIDHLYQINNNYQVIHVTLFFKSNFKEKNLNHELTLNYL